ncbi:hypothetical protein [Cellulomonas sp. ATA003]|uniref:hypothetical protein n=1 Tax=Cellulomonas sp. ATA003 TaxID=3073064 RepID=UPI002873B9AD|nr:hypothetical protein [Cellulomonas sp. ATA003]WNB87338.1 hypothetical protein REH70_09715 [Cellulomonas sp. ATA003]
MTWAEWALLAAAVLVVAVWAVWVEASRLDRLHRKVAQSRATLEAQLVRRATAAVELASTGVLDPVSSVLVGEAAFASLDAGATGGGPLAPVPADLALLVAEESPSSAEAAARPWAPLPAADRGLVESELSATLRAALDDPEEVGELRAEPGGDELLAALAAAWFRVQLARRFHNEAVAQTRRVRGKALVRWLRLAGHAPCPSPSISTTPGLRRWAARARRRPCARSRMEGARRCITARSPTICEALQ